jgi:hypothetical protein
MRKKVAIVVLILLIIGVLFVACAPSPEPDVPIRTGNGNAEITLIGNYLPGEEDAKGETKIYRIRDGEITCYLTIVRLNPTMFCLK